MNTFGNFLLDPFHQSRAAAARREILDHLPVPIVVVQPVESGGQGMTLLFRQRANCLFDGFDGHTLPT